MEYWNIIKFSGLLGSLSWVLITLIKEIFKHIRINKFKKYDNSKIKAIAYYENKSKSKPLSK